MNKINLGYCIIVNPFSEEKETMIFVSKKNSPSLNTEIFEQPSYNEACLLLKRLGFVQTEILTFENIQGTKVDVDSIKSQLEFYGMTYNNNLEASIYKEIKAVTEHSKDIVKIDKDLADPVTDISRYLEHKSKANQLKLSRFPVQINAQKAPEYGETISLSFYLFLEATLLKDGEILFLLNGDFYSKKNDKHKKFVKIVECKFRRIDTGKPNELHFESLYRYGDFIKEIDCLYTANFEFQPTNLLGYENKPLEKKYSIMEIRNVINLDNYIIVTLNDVNNYGKLVGWSNKIKYEAFSNQTNTIAADFLIAKTERIQKKLTSRMNEAAEHEDYEVAQTYKQSIGELQVAAKWLKDKEGKDIPLQDYNQYMSIKEVAETPEDKNL